MVTALSRADGPLSAAELAEIVDVPQSSLYRTLSVLEETGVVTHHLGAKGLTRYELDEWLTGHHHHLVCVDCGSVTDVEILAENEQKVQDLVAAISSSASFVPMDHALEIEGLCRRCA